MKKFILAILISISMFCSVAASGRTEAKDPVVSETGFIRWYGNEPFAYPGFVTEEGKIYSIAVEDSSSFSMEDITKLQGHRLQIYGRIDRVQIGGFMVQKDGVFVITRFVDLSAR